MWSRKAFQCGFVNTANFKIYGRKHAQKCVRVLISLDGNKDLAFLIAIQFGSNYGTVGSKMPKISWQHCTTDANEVIFYDVIQLQSIRSGSSMSL